MELLPILKECIRENRITTTLALSLCIITGIYPPWGIFHPKTGMLVENVGNHLMYDPPENESNIIFSRVFYYWIVIVFGYIFTNYVEYIVKSKKFI